MRLLGSILRKNGGVLIGLCTLTGFLIHYYFLYISPEFYKGSLMIPYERIFSGIEYAPFQYRFMPALVLVPISNLNLLSDRHLVFGFELICLFAGYFALMNITPHRQGKWTAVIVALTISFWGLGTMLYPKPESCLVFLGVSLGAHYLYDRSHKIYFLAACLILATTRVELLITYSLVLFKTAFPDRFKTKNLDCLFALILSIIISYLLRFLYGGTSYPPGVSVIQWRQNAVFGFWIWLVHALPYILAIVSIGRCNGFISSPMMLARDWIILYTVAVFFVGRMDEVRLWFCFSGVLGICISFAIGREMDKLKSESAIF